MPPSPTDLPWSCGAVVCPASRYQVSDWMDGRESRCYAEQSGCGVHGVLPPLLPICIIVPFSVARVVFLQPLKVEMRNENVESSVKTDLKLI